MTAPSALRPHAPFPHSFPFPSSTLSSPTVPLFLSHLYLLSPSSFPFHLHFFLSHVPTSSSSGLLSFLSHILVPSFSVSLLLLLFSPAFPFLLIHLFSSLLEFASLLDPLRPPRPERQQPKIPRGESECMSFNVKPARELLRERSPTGIAPCPRTTSNNKQQTTV